MDDYFWNSFNPEYDEISDMIQTIIDKNKHVDADIHIDPTYINKAIKRVILSNPATIILWNDGTKTVTKCCDGDVYDPETGMVMCIMKHLFGDTNRWRNIIGKHIKNSRANDKKKVCKHDCTKLNNKSVECIPSDDGYQIISCIISKDDKNNEDS